MNRIFKSIELTILFLILCLIGKGQNIEASISEFNIWANPEQVNGILYCNFDITNPSENYVNIHAKREIICEDENSLNRFCWAGICYSDSTDESLLSLAIGPNETIIGEDENEEGFLAYFTDLDDFGYAKIKYIFYEENNPGNSTSVTVSYCLGSQTECETFSTDCNSTTDSKEIDSRIALNCSPNPASYSANIDFSFLLQTSNARLIIRDSFGKEIKSISLPNQTGSIMLDVSQMDIGTYFYSIIDDYELLTTSKLVVIR